MVHHIRWYPPKPTTGSPDRRFVCAQEHGRSAQQSSTQVDGMSLFREAVEDHKVLRFHLHLDFLR